MLQTKQLGVALLALLISLPLVSLGFAIDASFLWRAGLLLLTVGVATPIYERLRCGDSCNETSKRRLWSRRQHLREP